MEYAEYRPKNIIILTGLSASGKSTVAEKLGQEICAPVISLRQDVLHPVAIENGYTRARFWILATHEDPSLLNLERKRLVEVIEGKTKVNHTNNIIIDDLIDPETPHFLREVFDQSQITVILIKSNRHLRRRWIIKRTEGSDMEALEEQRWLDGIKINAGIFQTIREADFKVKNMSKIEDTVTELRLLLDNLR